MSALQTLNLSGNQIGDKGAASLSGVLPGCKALQALHLCNNSIADVGAGSVSTVLVVCITVVALSLDGNLIGAKARAGLWKAWLGAQRLRGHVHLCIHSYVQPLILTPLTNAPSKLHTFIRPALDH